MGPLQASRIQRRSCQLTIDCSRAVVTSAYNIGPSPGTTIFGNFINPPSARKAANQRGFVRNWLTNGSIIPSLRLRSSLTPFRRSRSRIPATGVSMVTTRAEKPAARARSIADSAQSRPPRRYSWYQTGAFDAAATSSKQQPERVESVYPIPAAPAARAAASSPRG